MAGGTVHILMSELAINFIEDKDLKKLLQENFDIVLWNSWYPDVTFDATQLQFVAIASKTLLAIRKGDNKKQNIFL